MQSRMISPDKLKGCTVQEHENAPDTWRRKAEFWLLVAQFIQIEG